MKQNLENNIEVITKLRELYIIQNHHFLQQNKSGEYRTFNNYKNLRLYDDLFQKHLQGKYTLGTFAGDTRSKFICFDVDFTDLSYAKWVTYKIIDVIEQLGIYDYYVSFSGKKGYHVELFFKDLISINDAKKFYYIVLKELNLPHDAEGQVEYRPSSKQGVKIPLGYHQETKKLCSYCDPFNSLLPMTKEDSYKYLLQIRRISNSVLKQAIEVYQDRLIDDIENDCSGKVKIGTNAIIDSQFPQNQQSILSKAYNYLHNGLQIQGTRHNALLYIAMYFKHYGQSHEETLELVLEWMKNQSDKTYTTPIDLALKDAIKVVDDVFVHDYQAIDKSIEIVKICKNVFNKILIDCKNESERKVLFSLIVQSMQYADYEGVFYMSSNKIEEATGLSKATIFRTLKKLIESELIILIENQRKQKGTYIMKPNKYKVNFQICVSSEDTMDIDINKECTITNQWYFECIREFYDLTELKKLLSRRQYERLVEEIKNIDLM